MGTRSLPAGSPRDLRRWTRVPLAAALVASLAVTTGAVGASAPPQAVAPPAAGDSNLPGPYDWVLEALDFEYDEHRFVLSVPTGAPWARQTLRDPTRVVLDLGSTLSRLPGAPGVHEIPIERGPVRAIRTSQYRLDPMDYRVRIVLEMRRDLSCEIEDRGDSIVLAVFELSTGGSEEPVPDGRRAPERAEGESIDGGATRSAGAVEDEVMAKLGPELLALTRARARTPGPPDSRSAAASAPAPRASARCSTTVVTAARCEAGRRADAAGTEGESDLALWRDAIQAADVHFRSGHPDSARALYERASELRPPEAEAAWAAYQAGNCYLLLGEPDQAGRWYRRVVREWPRSLWARVAREHPAARGGGDEASLERMP